MTLRGAWLSVVAFFTPVVLVRLCSACGGPLNTVTHDEESGYERGGNARARTRYACAHCGRRYSHVYHERFDGDSEQWWHCVDERWETIDDDRGPRLERMSGFRKWLWRARALTRRS
jgi:hypothetical protein